ISFIYGLCDSRERKLLWNDIISHANCFKKTPWSVIGDLNVTIFSHEHSNNYRVTEAMDEFNGALRLAELDDLKSTGLKFTWTNMRSGMAAISKKLDRALGISDHSPVSIRVRNTQQHRGRPFKFIKFWAKNVKFSQVVRQEWAKGHAGSPLIVIHKKLKSLKSCLREFGTRPDSIVADLRARLRMVQQAIHSGAGGPGDVVQERQLRLQVGGAARDEEAFFKQKSRIQWLKEGDSNT
ncbi:hypothetical protein CFOL_v3_23763, partial [Cephalotus follicularis]